jgi:hypothetical protein
MLRVGDRHEYWIWLNRGGRLSEVHCPAAMMYSFMDHVAVWGYIASLVDLVFRYIMQTASMAPGHLGDAWGLSGSTRRSGDTQVSGSTHSNVKTTLQ